MSDVAVQKSPSLFGRRMHRLEEIATRLTGLYQDLGATNAEYHAAKAATYLHLMQTTSVSHGERQSRAGLENVHLETEARQIQVQIDQLREERDMLRFLVEWDAG